MVKVRRILLWGFVVGLLVACGAQPSPTPGLPSPTPGPEPGTTPTRMPEPSPTVAPVTATTAPSPEAQVTVPAATAQVTGCRLGTGMRNQTISLLLAYADRRGLVMAASPQLAEEFFPQLEGWIRVLGAPSLAELEEKAARAAQRGTPYEALAYGLETGESTPAEEWGDLVASTEKARALADRYGKLLLMGPGFRLMADHEEAYAPMAALSDIWMLQTQQLQKEPPGPGYRSNVERVVGLIRAGNPDIVVWAQITLPPDREPDAGEWLAYRESIADLVDGTYLGVYTWGTEDANVLAATMETVFEQCGGTE